MTEAYSKNYSNSYPNYRNSRRAYQPKPAVKTFTDLDIYQRAEEASVFVCMELLPGIVARAESSGKQARKKTSAGKVVNEAGYGVVIMDSIVKNLVNTALEIPRLIAESHSKRFGASTECLDLLDKAMLKCNMMVVYLEQARDILEPKLESARLAEEIQNYFYIRGKVLNLQRVWRKYIEQNPGR